MKRFASSLAEPDRAEHPISATGNCLKKSFADFGKRPRPREQTDDAVLRRAPAFGSHPVGNVAQIGRENRVALVAERGDGELDQNLDAVRAHCCNLDASIQDRAFTGGEIMGEAATMSFAQFGRNDQFRQFLADGFRARITEDSFRGRIEFEHAPLCVHNDDAVERGRNNGAIQGLERSGSL